ncbi:MAG: polysaccharide deacetylase family protein [Bdellovibrionales bacterium]|nr:polysaccharide deacetylase family protein [Bdellovibrionales bacterium]
MRIIFSALLLSTAVLSSSRSSEAQTASLSASINFPTRPQEVIRAYRYLEARSADFTKEFDNQLNSGAGDILETELYARLWATRILREEAAHHLAEGMLRTAAIVRNPEGNVAFRNREARRTEAEIFKELSQHPISGLPLVDDLIEALSHMDVDAMTPKYKDVHRDLVARVPMVYKAEERAKIEGSWGRAAETAGWRKHAKRNLSAARAKSMEDAIDRYGKALFNAGRAPAAAGQYGPSTGANGNLTGREFPSKMWALTYDDGPAKQTDEILNALAKRNMKATFFWLSKNAPGYASTSVARAKKEGHGLANHSATHAQLTKVSSAQLDKEILESTSALEALYGQKLGFFRLPYGAGRTDTSIRSRIEKAGLVHVFWNVDTLDWQDRNPTTIHQRTMKQVNQQGRGVILFHDIHSQTVTASARVMDDLKALSSRVVTMQEALSVLNGETP